MSSDKFFREKRAAARFKHNLLGNYTVPWATKTGSTAKDNRVVILDGYAGPGRYDPTPGHPLGEDGSPVVLGRAVREKLSNRRVELVFVENDKTHFAKLERLVADELADLSALALPGRVEDHLDKVLELADGVPLLAFLDPCGLGLPFHDVVDRILNRPAGRYVSTEILLNFTAEGVKRIGGRLKSDYEPGREATLKRMDDQCGNGWWRDLYLQAASPEEAAQAIAEEYMQRVNSAAKCGGWVVEARNAPHLQPAYNLVYFSRHSEGLLTFGEIVSKAQERWRQDVVVPGTIESDPETFKRVEKALRQGWEDTITSNMRSAFSTREVLKVYSDYELIMNGVVGDAREMHVRTAIKALHAEGVTETTGVNWDYKQPIKRAKGFAG